MKNMDRNEFIAKLQMVYVGDINALNEIIGVYDNLKEENQRLNNDIKILLKENEAKEKVIIKYDNVLNELEKLLNQELETIRNDEFFCNLTNEDYIVFILDKLKKLKESDK